MNPAATLLQEGLQLHRDGHLDQALVIYKQVAVLDPTHPEVPHLCGLIYVQQGEWIKGVELMHRALNLKAENPVLHFNLGNAYLERQLYDEALDHFDMALQQNPTYALAYLAQGKAFIQSDRLYSALASYARSLKYLPQSIDASVQLALCQAQLRQFQQASDRLHHLDMQQPGQALIARAIQDINQMRVYHQKVLDQALPPSLHNQPLALINAANQAESDGQFTEALELINASLAINPQDAAAYFQKGNIHLALEQYYAAIECFDHSTALNPNLGKAWHNAGSALCDIRQYPAAIEQFKKAIETTHDKAPSLFMKLMVQLNICDWSDYDNMKTQVKQVIENGFCPGLLQIVALTDSLKTQLQAAKNHYKVYYGDIEPWPFKKAIVNSQNRRIKIGYFSQDFREHAVSYLTAELFELHDRKRFEVIAFHYGERKDEPMQHRLRKAFDQFHDVKDLTDEAIVQMARDMNLDIAVDLAGFTANNRSGIFARRAAPVQINYIGYPASMGHPQMDYIIGDPIVTPPELHAGYSEKIISLPCFQVNDRQRKISDRVFTREELGIPEHQFVFCCFNATYKITPRVFDAWLQILKACPESCMLLVKDHDHSEISLKQLAKAQGVDVERLIFCTKESPADNLARYRVADLFLDSTPFNAGTTASDALWAGLPVLTCAGEAFASRMAASLLHAVGLPELVTHSLNEYQRKAIELAQSTDGTKAFKQRLVDHRESCVLFDTPMFVVHLEAALIAINQAGNSH